MSRKIVLFVIIAICFSGCSSPPEDTIPPDTPTPEPIATDTPTLEPSTLEEIIVVFDIETSTLDEIIIVFDNLFPEGLEYDENGGRFLLGSMSQRSIFQVFDDGTFEPFIEDPDLIECYGLEIDRNNNRLLVVNNIESDGKSYLNSYDLSTGERIFRSEISSIKPDLPHSANDVAVDADGNAYVTDWASDAIYRVDMEGNPILFMEHTQFATLNGIVYHPNGFLLLGSYPGSFLGEFILLKIPLDNPEVIEVEITDGYWGFILTDGMIMDPDGTVIMVTYPRSDIGRLQSEDDWETAQVIGKSVGHADGNGSTIALRGEEVYVIYSHMDQYYEGLDQSKFEIVRVKFE